MSQVQILPPRHLEENKEESRNPDRVSRLGFFSFIPPPTYPVNSQKGEVKMTCQTDSKTTKESNLILKWATPSPRSHLRSLMQRTQFSVRIWRLRLKHFLRAAGISAMFSISILIQFQPSLLAEVNPVQAQRVIIGEAANQGLEGMIGVAEVIRRRGSLKGFYGLKRESFIDSQPKWVHIQAEKAWEMSAKTNLTKGADHFENTKAFGVPYWAKNATKTASIKDHDFYLVKS